MQVLRWKLFAQQLLRLLVLALERALGVFGSVQNAVQHDGLRGYLSVQLGLVGQRAGAGSPLALALALAVHRQVAGVGGVRHVVLGSAQLVLDEIGDASVHALRRKTATLQARSITPRTTNLDPVDLALRASQHGVELAQSPARALVLLVLQRDFLERTAASSLGQRKGRGKRTHLEAGGGGGGGVGVRVARDRRRVLRQELVLVGSVEPHQVRPHARVLVRTLGHRLSIVGGREGHALTAADRQRQRRSDSSFALNQ